MIRSENITGIKLDDGQSGSAGMGHEDDKRQNTICSNPIYPEHMGYDEFLKDYAAYRKISVKIFLRCWKRYGRIPKDIERSVTGLDM